MKMIGRMRSLILLAAIGVSVSSPILASPLEDYLSEAALKAEQGDLESAAVLYQKALKLDKNNLTARKELARVLMEARLKDPDAEHSDAELAVIKEATSSS